MDEPGPLRRVVNATRYSRVGMAEAWRTQAALRYEIYLLLILVPLAWRLGSTALERALLIASWLLVIVVELLNSAIETIVDRIGGERHELSGRAKDIGSAAVFGAIVLAATVWLFGWVGQLLKR
ncbi:MAG: diacylglycerol kinase [Chloroflexota bacterium]